MLKLAHAPTFKGTVELPLPGGKTAHIECEFKWMHARDLQAFLDKVRVASTADKRAVRLAQFILRGLAHVPGLKDWATKRQIPYRSDFDYLDEIIASWSGVDLQWGPEACAQLIKLYPQAVVLIIGAWAKGLAENRLGN